MLAAVLYGRKDICQLLYDHGAHNDVKREDNGFSPLRCVLHPAEPLEGVSSQDLIGTAQWLILHGAIPTDGNGNPKKDDMGNLFSLDCTIGSKHGSDHGFFVRERLQQWAENICSVHNSFFVFLCGTTFLPRLVNGSDFKPISHLIGHEGIRKRIADYVGVVTGQNLRTVRGIVRPLKHFSVGL